MVIRIRLKGGVATGRLRSELALASAAFLTPSALIAFTICVWSFAAELGLTGKFYISSGLFSHWQFWLLAAVMLLLCGRLLGSYGAAKGQVALE